MAKESRNGFKPDEATAPDEDDGSGGTEYERFERLARLLVTVPKETVDRELKRAKRKPARSR